MFQNCPEKLVILDNFYSLLSSYFSPGDLFGNTSKATKSIFVDFYQVKSSKINLKSIPPPSNKYLHENERRNSLNKKLDNFDLFKGIEVLFFAFEILNEFLSTSATVLNIFETIFLCKLKSEHKIVCIIH